MADEAKVKIKITRRIRIAGKAAGEGDVVSVPATEARYLIATRFAEAVSAKSLAAASAKEGGEGGNDGKVKDAVTGEMVDSDAPQVTTEDSLEVNTQVHPPADVMVEDLGPSDPARPTTPAVQPPAQPAATPATQTANAQPAKQTQARPTRPAAGRSAADTKVEVKSK